MSEIYLGTPPPGVVSWCEKKYGPQYMTIEALDDGVNIVINHSGQDETGTFQVQLNDDQWKDVSWEDIGTYQDFDIVYNAFSKSSMSKGDKLRFKNIDKWSSSNGYTALMHPSLSGKKYKVYGKLSDSLTPELTMSTQSSKLSHMFMSSCNLVDASELDLTDILLADSCFNFMFSSCNSLTKTPKLSTTKLATNCYAYMFESCPALTSAPELPAMTLASGCYDSMFAYCGYLVNAPALPATALANGCYSYMFGECSNITELHFPKSAESQIRAMDDGPTFGAVNATAYFDL